MTRRALFAPLLLVLSACPPDTEEPEDITSQLTRQGGCADLVLYAANDDDTLAVHFTADGLVGDTPIEPAETIYDFAFPTAEVSLLAARGAYLTEITCNDVLEHEVVTDVEYEAVSGTATLTVRPNAAVDDSPRVDLVLEDVVLESEDGEQVLVDGLTWTNVSVGWFPG